MTEEKKPRFRVDFSIRELDVDPETARGVRFGDEVDVEDLAEFFNKHRDLVRTMFQPAKKHRSADEIQQEMNKLMAEREEAKKREQAKLAETVTKMKQLVGDRNIKVLLPQAPAPRDPYREKNWDYDEMARDYAHGRSDVPPDPYAGKSKSELDRMDDGDGDGDGPSDPRYVEAYRRALDPNRDRY